MAEGKQVKVDLTFNADVTAAKKAMQNLMEDINNLTSGSLKNSPIGGLNNDLLKASQAANQLKQNLSTAFNVKTGNLDLVKFNASMKSAGLSLKQYQDSLMALGPAGAQSFAQLSMAIMRADAPLARVNSKLNEFTTSLKNTAKWQLSSSILHGLMGSINQAYSYAQNLNASLNDIRIVTGASADEMARFAETANKAAKSLSTSTKTYTDAALIFYQQGLGDAEVKERTDAVIKMANVTKDSAAEVSSYMTAIWNNFDDGSKSLEHYADVMTALGAATASSTAEIADGLEKFASIGKTIGLSYDYATSALATIVAQTRQSADTVGTGLRTIFSRLQGLSLGETLEDGVDLNKYSKALSAVGVSVLDATGNMRDMDTILDSLADKWSNLSAAQKTALAQTVGGVRQYTTLISLMDNWDSMETNLNTAKNSSGALQDQANIYAESWEAAKNRVRASAEAIYASLINDKFFISLNNGFSGFLDQINNVIDGLGGLKGVLMSLTPIITSLFRGQINGGIRSALTSFKALLPSGRRDQDATRAEAVQRTATAYDNLSNQEGHAMATHSRNTASLQQAYYNNQRNMSNEQRQLAQQKITQYNEVFGKRVGEAGKRGDTAAENLANTQRTTRRAMARLMAPHQAIIDKEKQVTEEWQKDPKNQRMYNLANRGNKLKSRNKSAMASREAQLQEKLNTDVGSQEKRDKARIVAEKVQKAQSAQTKLLQKSQSLGFQDAAAKAIQTKINVDTKDVDKAKQQLRDLIATIEKAATENNIDLEASGMRATLDALKQKADDANASIQDLRAAAQGLDANADMASAQADSAQEQGEEDDPDDTGFEQAARDAGMDDDKVKQVSQETRQGGEESGAAILEGAVAANEAKGAMEAFREEIEKAGQVDVDFASGFTAAASAVTALGTTISSVMGLMDVWQDDSMSLGEKLSTTFMTGGAALLSFSSAFSGANAQLLKGIPAALASALGFKTAGDSAERAGQDAAKSSPGFLAAGLTALKSGLTAMAGWLPLIGLFAAIVLAVVGIVAIFAAISDEANANAKAIAELEAENEKLRGSIDAAGAAMATLEGDLQSLSAVMHDTSLSYEEQLSKINEITNAYGVQASAIDVLTGNYAGLEAEMKAALLAREGALVTNLEDYQQQVYENSDELLNRYRDSDKYNAIQGFEGLLGVNKTASFDQGFQKNGKTTAADAFAPYNNINKTEVSMREAWQKYSGQAGNELTDKQWERIQPMLEKYGFITQNKDGTWSEHLELMLDKNGNYTADMNRLLKEMEDDGYAADDYDEIKDYLNQRKKDAKSGHAALESALTINANNTNNEGKAWEALLSQEGAAEKYGLRWDSKTQSVQLTNGELTGANYASLYEDISNNVAFADYGFDESSFTGKMMSAAELSGADIMASAEEKIERANLMSSIINSDDFTFMTNTHTKDYEELLKFRRKDTEGNTTSLLESSFDDAMETAKYLSGFQEYQEAGMRMQAIGELATQAGQIHGKGNAEKATEYRDEIYKEIQSQIASGVIDIDTALRLSPSSIVVTANGSEINVEIPPEAIKLAETKAAKELQLEVRTNIDAIYDVATKDTLNYEDIKALQESEYFKDNPEDAVHFASQSQAQRQLELDRAKEESYIKEAEANRQLVEQLQAEQARLQTDADSVMNQAIADFGADGTSREALFNLKAFQDKGYGSDKIQELQQMDAQGLYQFARGEMEELQKKKAGLEQQQSDLLADMGYAAIEEAQAAANKMEDGDDKDALLQQIQDYEGNAVKLENTTTAYEEYEGLLSGVIQAEQELLSVSSQLKIAQGDQAALNWWATYGAEITKATNAADSFSKAIGKKGQLSADDLAYLEAYDESGKALDNYQNMSSQEWDKYAMESAVAYYDELYAYYDGDVAKQIEILQLKQQAQQQYYDSVEEMASKHFKLLKEKYDENIENITTAQSSIASIFEGDKTPTFSALGELRRELLELGYDATQVGEIIQNLGKSDKEDKTKEDILTQLGLETELSLNKLTQMGKMERNYGNAIGVTIADYQFAPSVPSEGKEMRVPATSTPEVIPGTPSDIPGLKWENNQYNFKAAGGGSIVINGTKGEGIKEVGSDSITLVDTAPGGGEITVSADPENPTAVDLVGNKWVVTNPENPGQGSIEVSGTPGIDTGVKCEGNKWQLTATEKDGGTSTITINSDNKTVGTKYEGGKWQLTATEEDGGTSTITVASDDTTTGVEYQDSTWAITDLTEDGGTSTIKVASDNSGVTGVEYKENIWAITGLKKDGGTTTIKVASNEGEVGIQWDANASSWKLRGTTPEGGNVEYTVSAKEATGGKISWNGTSFEIDTTETVTTNYQPGTGQAPQAEVHQTVYVSYVDENTRAGLHRSAAIRNIMEDYNFGGEVTSGYFANTYGGASKKLFTVGDEGKLSSEAAGFLHRLYMDDGYKRYMGNKNDEGSALSLALGALRYSEGAGNWLLDFGDHGGKAQYKFATEQIGTQLNEHRAQMLYSLGYNAHSSYNGETLDKLDAETLQTMGLSAEEQEQIKATYQAAYDAAIAEGVGKSEAAKRAAEAVTSDFVNALNPDATYVQGMHLYEGLIQGWQDAYGNATTFADTALSVLGDLADAFEIHSPSRATRRMGVWLMQGLNEGWNSTSFDAGNIGDMALSAIKTSLATAFGDGINWLEYLRTDENGNLIKLMTQEQLDSIWETLYGEETITDYTGANINDSENNKINSLNKIATLFDSDEQAGLSADEMNSLIAELPQKLQDAITQWQKDNEGAQLTMEVIAELAINTEELADNWDETMLQDLLLGEASGEALANYITGGYLDTITDPTTKALFAEAKKDFFEKNDKGIKTDLHINAGNAQEVLDHVYEYMSKNLGEYRKLIDTEIDNMLTKWTTALGELYAEETEYAKNLVTMWTETYSTIAKIRTALLGDTDATVMSTIGDDADAVAKLLNNARMNGITSATDLFNKWYYGTGMTETDASITAFNAPTQLWGESEYGLISKAFSYDANGMINFGQSWTDFDTQQTAIVSGLVDKYLVGDGSIVQEQINKLYEAAADTSNLESANSAQLLLEILTNKGIITVNKNSDNQVTGYSINDDAGETQGITIKDLLATEVGLDEAGFYNAQNALGGYEFARRQREGQAAIDRGEARLEAATNKIDLLTRAASGEKADAFSAQEQAEIYKILGINPSSVSFAELLTSMPDLIVRALNTATTEAETAGKTATAEHYLAGQGYVNVNGQWRRYNYDPQEMIAKSIGPDGIPSAEMVSRYRVGANGQVQEYNQTKQQYETATIENLTVTVDGTVLAQTLTTGGFTTSVNTDGSLNVSNVGSYTIPNNDNLNGAAAGNVGTDTATKIKEAWTELDEYIRLAESAGILMTAEEIMSDRGLATIAEAVAIQRQYALQLKVMEAGLKALNSSGKGWIKTLKKQGVSLEEQADAMKNLRKNYADVLGLTDKQAKKLSKTFLENEDNLRLIEKAAKDAGVEGQQALDQLQVAAAQDLYKESDMEEMSVAVAALAEQVSQLNLDAGDMITGTDEAYGTLHGFWNNVLQDAITSGKNFQDAVDIANDAMNNLGYGVEPLEFVSVDMTADELTQHLSVETNTAYDATGKPIQVSDVDSYYKKGGSTTYTVQIPKGKGGSSSGPTFTKKAERPGVGSSGGGGGSRRRYLAKAKPEDHKERYHEINNALDDVSDALERLNEQQDRAWGSARIKAMQQEAALLKEQTELYHQKRKEAEEYLKIDRKKAEDAGWTFDENGNVSNYEERLDAVIAEYNQKIEEYNAMSAQEQEAKEKLITEANERFEKGDKDAEQYLNPETGVAFGSYEEYLKYTFFDAPKEALETYEGTMEEWEEIQKNILTNLYTEYDNYVEQIKYTAENMLELIDDQIKYIEHKLSRMEDNAYKTAESIELITSQIEASESKIAVAEQELATLLGAHKINVEDFLSGKVSAEDLKNAGFTDAEIEELRNIMTTAQDAEKDMSETLTKGIESMSTAFESFNAELDRYTSSIEHAQSITSTYRNILDLTGKSLSGFSVELLKAFNESTIEQAKANMSANKTKYETVQVEYDKALQVWELAQAQYAAGLMEDSAYLQAKKTFEDTEDALQEAQESYISSWEAAIQAVADAYQSTMEAVIEDVGKKLANGMTGGLDALSEYMDRAKTTESNYVDDYEKIYQLTKLTRDLDSKIDNTQNVKTQKELLKFQKEINALLQSDKQLSEYDIDYLQKKYDLKLAEIALEDAQNAKSQVTMRRDSEGNYNYVYTADENAVAEAEAEYEGKLYEMQKANDEYITSLSDNIISLEQEMLQAIGALDPAQFASEEDYNNRVADIIKFYTEQMEYQSSEMGKVLANNKSLYDNDMKWYAEYRDYKMADAATFLDSWDKILLAQVSGFSTQEEFFNNFKQQAGSLANESLGAYATWAQKIGEINTSAGTSTGTLGEDIGKKVQELTDDAKDAAEKMETSAGKIKDSVTGITGAVIGMLDQFEGRVGAAADRVDLLTLSIMSLFKTLGVNGFENLQLDGKLSELWLKIQATENAKPTATTSEDGPDTGYDTGGYTGSWGTEGRLAFLHQKELVLNAHDTENMLASVGILRQIASVIDLNALTSAGGFANLSSSGISHNREPLQQEVHIEAHFPNATDKNQIEEAFKDIVNLASQYANSF